MPRVPFSDNHYGGVQFGYTRSSLRLFYPIQNETGCLASITESWGYLAGTHQQCVRRARLTIRVWGDSMQTGRRQTGTTVYFWRSTVLYCLSIPYYVPWSARDSCVPYLLRYVTYSIVVQTQSDRREIGRWESVGTQRRSNVASDLVSWCAYLNFSPRKFLFFI